MADGQRIVAVERLIVAVNDLDAARARWRRAGFSVALGELRGGGLRCARFAAGAVAIDLCVAADPAALGAIAEPMRTALAAGGGILGWMWGAAPDGRLPKSAPTQPLPGPDGTGIEAVVLPSLDGVFTAAIEVRGDFESRRADLRCRFGDNPNTVDYLEHIVVMAPDLDRAIAIHEALGVGCRRIREAGGGVRQAFFKLEQTVLEVVGPARGRPGCWGVAFMCRDIAAAVVSARAAGMQATEPKAAIQGGKIARIIDPLDGVAVAFMEAPPQTPG